MEQKNWHNLTAAETLQSLNSAPHGLSSEEAQSRLAQFGPNELAKEKKTPLWRAFLEQFKNFLIIILLAAVVISTALAIMGEGDIWDPILIMVIVLFATILGFVQEYRAGQAMEALKRMTAPTSTVIRDGDEVTKPSSELVPGDVIVLREGDRIAADGRLVDVVSTKVDEAPLTGESTPVDKRVETCPVEVSLGDRRNMVYTGTTVVYGKGRAVVTSTGMATEFGKIAGMLQEVKEPPTPLEVELDRVGKWLGILLLAISGIVAILGIIRLKLGILEMLIWGVSLAIAAVPEALPAVITISLAYGVYRMSKRHALVRRLPAVETLGCTTFICSDKTGTLTQNQMTVRKVYVDGQVTEVSGAGYEPRGEFRRDGNVLTPGQDPSLQKLLQISALCNDAGLVLTNGAWSVRGDPTEGALLVVAEKAGLKAANLSESSPRVGEIPFSSERKRMTTIHQTPRGKLAFCKGAAEVVLDSCNRIYMNGEEKQLSPEDKARVLEANSSMAAEALRVLGMAYKPLPESYGSLEEAEKDMVFVGLAGMIDPPREEVKPAIQVCQKAGIKSVMITGDHKMTAVAIAKELGLLQEGLAITGAELENIPDQELEKTVEKIEVYARVSPAHKMRIVEALQTRGHVVAMTGDGVNDAPALKRADIGVAMGITGTDVSKEASHMVLTDDNFASIVAAVEEGRGIFGNVKKYLAYLLSANIGEIILMLLAVLLGLPLPLVAVQLLWVNLVTDGLPALALAIDPAEPDIMERPPRSRKESIFTPAVNKFLGGVSIWIGLVTLGVFYWAYKIAGEPLVEARGVAFVTLILLEMFNVFNCRSMEHSLFKIGVFSNKWIPWAVASSVVTTLIVVYVPFFQGPFHTTNFSLWDWVVTILASSSVFIMVEIGKRFGVWREKRASVVPAS